MSVIKKVFKSIFPSKFKTIDSHKHHNKPKLELDKHDQDVMDIMKLMPITEFDDGNDKSAFLIDSKLLSGFLGPELGGVISDLSNNFDFGFEGA